ncbi:MAG: hypothetical protein AAF788_00340 [Pseudomonadota bacterium]
MIKHLAGLVLVGVAACASKDAPIPALRPGVPQVATEAPDPSPLEQYDIPSGRCGMILWSTAGSRVVPIFRSVDATLATMRIEGEDIPLSLVAQEGALRLGMRASQQFSGATSKQKITVDSNIQWGQPFPGGIYVQRGTLTTSGEDGWGRVMPVAGIAGCKA